MLPMSDNSTLSNTLYRRIWRWHFLAACYVIPFFLILAITGLIMASAAFNQSKFGEAVFLDDAHSYQGLQKQAISTHILAAQSAFPQASIDQYVYYADAHRAAQIQLRTERGALIVSLNPYSNEIISSVEKDSSLYAWANKIHGGLLLGDVGDFLLELAASLGIFMLVSGFYLWLVKANDIKNKLNPFGFLIIKGNVRERFKYLHGSIGFYIGVILLFFLLSGLAWTNIWGGKLVQAWGTFPAERFAPQTTNAQQTNTAHSAHTTHQSLNNSSVKEVPWGLEQTPLPVVSHIHHEHRHHAMISVDTVAQQATQSGFSERYRIHFPKNKNGIFTVSASTMTGDARTPAQEKFVHLDPYSGEILAQVSFSDYSFAAKLMSISIALHQGEFGLANILANLVLCLAVIALILSGVWLAFLRKPAQAVFPSLPARTHTTRLPVSVILILSLLVLAFPLLLLALPIIIIFDTWILKA